MPSAKSGRNYFEFPAFLHWLYFLLLWLKTRGHSRIRLKQHVILDGGRFEENSGRSLFFDKLIQKLGKENITHLSRKIFTPKTYDYTLEEAERNFCFPSRFFFAQWRDSRLVYQKAKNSGRFDQEELDYLAACLHSFVIRYGKTIALYNNQQVKTVFFIVHYLNEGFISALHDLNVRCIELQHGLISNADLYYVYDERYRPYIQDAFFPDQLWVYGNLWRNRVLKGVEYVPGQVIVAGDYTHLFDKAINKPAQKENLLVICTQKFLADDYIPWIEKLQAHFTAHSDWSIIIKLHPRERSADIERYLRFQSHQIQVEKSGNLDEIFSRAKIQLSIYSTTFYDAIGYGVTNFALIDAINHASYIQEMIDTQVALPIRLNDDPISLSKKQVFNAVTRGDIYDSFPSPEIKTWIQKSVVQ